MVENKSITKLNEWSIGSNDSDSGRDFQASGHKALIVKVSIIVVLCWSVDKTAHRRRIGQLVLTGSVDNIILVFY